jgi:hypothetical protein
MKTLVVLNTIASPQTLIPVLIINIGSFVGLVKRTNSSTPPVNVLETSVSKGTLAMEKKRAPFISQTADIRFLVLDIDPRSDLSFFPNGRRRRQAQRDMISNYIGKETSSGLMP